MAIDTTGATDLAGTGFDMQGDAPLGTPPGVFGLPVAALAPTGTSVSGYGNVVPVQEFYLVNLINASQLNRFGQNANPDFDLEGSIDSNNQSVPEKLEGMALIPENDPAKPNTFILLVGSDNDYIVQDPGVWENGAFLPGSADNTPNPGESDDTKLYAYEVTLPGASVFVVPPAPASTRHADHAAVGPDLPGRAADGLRRALPRPQFGAAAPLKTYENQGPARHGQAFPSESPVLRKSGVFLWRRSWTAATGGELILRFAQDDRRVSEFCGRGQRSCRDKCVLKCNLGTRMQW